MIQRQTSGADAAPSGKARRRVRCGRLLASTLPLAGLPLSVAAWSAATTNTVSVTAPTGTLEANTANNTVSDTSNVLAVLAAVNDSVAGVNGLTGATNVLNAFAGDTINGAPASAANATLSVASGATVPAGLTFDPATGSTSVAPGIAAGTYSFNYTICETANPANCKTATETVTVSATVIAADADSVGGVVGASGAIAALDVIPGDTINDVQVTLDKINLTVVTPATAVASGAPVPVLNPATGLIDVAAGTPAGTYSILYQICEKLNPANCATATATVTVAAAPILATPDTPPAVNSAIGGTGIINAFANDTLNGVAVDPAKITATVTAPATPINGGSVPALDPATGLVSVAPGTPAGTYTIGYQICETLNPANCSTSAITVVVEPARSNLSGTVYTDANGNARLDSGEPRLSGWIVQVLRNGSLVGATTTDAQGNYAFTGLLSGSGYTVVFRNPLTDVVYGTIANLNLGVSTTVVDQNQPIDPSGLFYDSVARVPVGGSVVTLVDASNNPLPVECYLDASQRNQRVGSDGRYRFDLVPGASAQCPAAETLYRIAVTPPAGFSFSSTVLLPQAGALDPTGAVSPYRVATTENAPSDAAPVYYLAFRLASGDPHVINNHIPLDPFLTRTPLVVTKTSIKRSASTGDLVPYVITVRNRENAQRAAVSVIDVLPAGMKYVQGSARVNGVAIEPTFANENRELVWKNQIIPANGTVRYDLILTVGAGVVSGERVNTGLAQNGIDGTGISNRGTAVIQITPSSVFDCSELLGKVFEDRNGNGYQDDGEPGVPGVRLATVNGHLITTDQFGRYHIACAAVPDARIGSNFVLKVDVRTLPLGWIVTTDNPRSIRLTRGKFGELNFGVAPGVPVEPTLPERTPPTSNRKGGE